jgi:hypothetical protein
MTRRKRREIRFHAIDPRLGRLATRTMCGRDLNPSCGAWGSHSAVPMVSSFPTCRACRSALTHDTREAGRLGLLSVAYETRTTSTAYQYARRAARAAFRARPELRGE